MTSSNPLPASPSDVDSKAQAPVELTEGLNLDSDEALPVCGLRNNGDEICDVCQ